MEAKPSGCNFKLTTFSSGRCPARNSSLLRDTSHLLYYVEPLTRYEPPFILREAGGTKVNASFAVLVVTRVHMHTDTRARTRGRKKTSFQSIVVKKKSKASHVLATNVQYREVAAAMGRKMIINSSAGGITN